ncbi:MAG: helix-turn-helix domain-containing protein [Acidobacteria bacterium]|nr:helix-turn-helix domain-containing protein [Acidobacteriota bacterium]
MASMNSELPETIHAVNQRLESWKEIADYLKRSVRTVRRWEQLEGLPVYRHTHNKDATVYSFRVELDEWLARRSEEPAVRDGANIAVAQAQTAEAPVAWQLYRWGFFLFATFGFGILLTILYGVWFRNWHFLIRF